MDGFCQKVPGMLEKEQYSELKLSFKSKVKTLNQDEIQYFYDLSVNKNLTCVILLVLKFRIKNIMRIPEKNWDVWINCCYEFMMNLSGTIPLQFHKELYSCALKYGELCADIGRKLPNYLKTSLRALMHVLTTTRDKCEITPIHYIVCRLALQSRKLFEVEDLTKNDYVLVSKNTGLKGAQCVLFFYYIGSISLILKKYSRAYHFYELSLTIPSKHIHAACVESYKKLVLLRLIIDGSEYHVPRYTNQRFVQLIRSMSTEAYTSLASLFSEFGKNKISLEEIDLHINKYSNIWISDQNTALIKKLQISVKKLKIKKLTRVYASLSLNQLIHETQIEDAEKILIKMVENGEISAKIDKRLSLVVFEDIEEDVKVDQIQDVCQKLIQCSEYLERGMVKVCMDQRYLKDVVSMENMQKN